MIGLIVKFISELLTGLIELCTVSLYEFYSNGLKMTEFGRNMLP